jgi:hypothetical protein
MVPPAFGRAALAKSYADLTLFGVAAVVVLVDEVESVRETIPAVEVEPVATLSVRAVPPV